MLKPLLRICVPLVLLLLALGSTASAYTRITLDSYWYDQPVTAYYAFPDLYDPCRTKQPLGDNDCYGARGNVLNVGDAAVHYMGSNPLDPVAQWGSVVTTPKTISLKYPNGTFRTANYYFVSDTGPASAYPENTWLDIYCGDALQSAPKYNSYYNANRQTVESNFGSSPNNALRFTLYFDIVPVQV
jgi:hypothetical protein